VREIFFRSPQTRRQVIVIIKLGNFYDASEFIISPKIQISSSIPRLSLELCLQAADAIGWKDVVRGEHQSRVSIVNWGTVEQFLHFSMSQLEFLRIRNRFTNHIDWRKLVTVGGSTSSSAVTF